MADNTFDFQKALQGVAGQVKSVSPTSGGFFHDLAGGAIEAFRSGTADLPRVLQKVTDAVSNAAASKGSKVDRLVVFKQLSDAIAPKDFNDQATLAWKIGGVFGGLVPALAKYGSATAMAGPLGLGAATLPVAMGTADAASSWGRDESPEDIGKAALGGGAFGALLGPVGSKLSRWPRAGVAGGGATAIAALEGETKPENLALTGLTMTAMGAMGGRFPTELKSKLNKLGYPDEFLKKVSMKDAREIAKNNQKFVAPETIIPPSEVPPAAPPTSLTNMRSLLGQEKKSQVDSIKNSDLIYDKILLGRKFTDEQIASWPLATKLAVANSPYDASMMKVEPISGRITLTGKAPGTTKTTPESTITTEKIPGFGGTVEDLVVDPATEANLNTAMKDMSSKGTIVTEIPAATTKPVVNKEIVNQLKWKYTGITDGDAKKVATLLDERGIKIPSDASAFLESIPVMTMVTQGKGNKLVIPKGEKLYDHIINFEKKQELLKEQPTLEAEVKKAKVRGKKQEPPSAVIDVSPLTKEEEVDLLAKKDEDPAAMQRLVASHMKLVDNIASHYANKGVSLDDLKQEGKIGLIQAVEKFDSSRDNRLSAFAGKYIEGSMLKALKTKFKETGKETALPPGYDEARKEGGPRPTQFVAPGQTAEEGIIENEKNAAVRKMVSKLNDKEQFVIKHLVMTDDPMTLEAVGKELNLSAERVRQMKVAALKKLKTSLPEYGLQKDVEDVIKGPVSREQLIGKASVLWPNRRSDLALLSDKDLRRIVDEKIIDTKASITPSGKLVEIAAGDKALAGALDVAPGEGIKIREAIEKESPRTQEGLLKAAAEFMDVPYKTVASLSDVEKQSVINAYLQHADQNIDQAQKAGKILEKEEVDATRAYNNIIDKSPDTDPALAKLKRQYTEINRKEIAAKANYRKGLIDRVDLNLITTAKQEILTKIEKQRNEIKKKASAPAKVGDATFLSALVKDDNGGIIVVKKLPNNVEEFQFLTKEGQSPIPGDSGLSIAGKMTIGREWGKPVELDTSHTFDIPQADYFKDQFRKIVDDYYKNKGEKILTPGEAKAPGAGRLYTGIDPELIQKSWDKIDNSIKGYFSWLNARRGATGFKPEDRARAWKDIYEVDESRWSDETKKAILYERAGTTEDPKTGKVVTLPEDPTKSVMMAPTDWIFMSVPAEPTQYSTPALAAVAQKRLDLNIAKEGQKKWIFNVINNLRAEADKTGDPDVANKITKVLGAKAETNNPIIKETAEKIRVLLDSTANSEGFKDALKDRRVDNYVPAIMDMETNYTKEKLRWGQTKSIDELPESLQLAIDQDKLNQIMYIFKGKSHWDDLNVQEKSLMNKYVFSLIGGASEFEYLPQFIQDNIKNQKTFNQHLIKRKGHFWEEKQDIFDILSDYYGHLVQANYIKTFKDAVVPIRNQWPKPETPYSVRWGIDKLIKQTLHDPTPGDQILQTASREFNKLWGSNLLPEYQAGQKLAGGMIGQAARGVLGYTTAIKKLIPGFTNLWADKGSGVFGKALKSYIEGNRMPKELMEFIGLTHQGMEGMEEAGKLTARLGKAESLPGKAWEFYKWFGDMALSPINWSQNFKMHITFLGSLIEQGSKGEKFETAARFGLNKISTMEPDLNISEAALKGMHDTVRTVFGFRDIYRSPLTRGPLARMGTLFWSFPAKEFQFMYKGLVDSAFSGEGAKFARFSFLLGGQLFGIAALINLMGAEAPTIYKLGFAPVKPFAMTYDVIKDAYQMAFGKRSDDRAKGSEDLYNAAMALMVPQWAPGKGVYQSIQALDKGYRVGGAKEQPMAETSWWTEALNIMGFHPRGPHLAYDLVNQMNDVRQEHESAKTKLLLQASKSMEKGDMAGVRKVFEIAREKNIGLTYSALTAYHKDRTQLTYMEQRLKTVPKQYKAGFQKQIDELQKRIMPGLRPFPAEAGKSMWSAPSQSEPAQTEAEE